jgi:hypothetical protein
MLKMSKVAVALCFSVRVFLGFTTLVIAIGYRHYFKTLPRDMNTLSSIMALVSDSPKLSKWVAENGARSGAPDDRELKAAIGYFEGGEGDTRWGIELVDETYDEKIYGKGNSSGARTDYELLNVRSPDVDNH